MRIFIFFITFGLLSADNFLVSVNTPPKYSDTAVLMSSRVVPLSRKDFVVTPYGMRVLLTNDMVSGSNIESKSVYIGGSLVVIRSRDSNIEFYRYAKNNSNLYSKIAPSIHSVVHTAGNYYEISPYPHNIAKCVLVVSFSFEVPRLNHDFVLQLNQIPDKGSSKMLVECGK